MGDVGDDTLVGETGDDFLLGYLGNDLLNGGGGNDIYIFGQGDGRDVISDYLVEAQDTDSAITESGGDSDTLVLNSSITLNDVSLNLEDEDLVFTFNDSTEDRISISNYDDDKYRIEYFHIENQTFSLEEIISELLESTPTNNPPVLVSPIGTQTIAEDSNLSLAIAENFQDNDPEDVLSYTATLADGSELPSWLSFDSSTQTFSGTPTNDDVGSLNILVTATDIEGETVSDTFDLIVENVNDPPTLTSEIPDLTATEDEPFSFTLDEATFNDVDAEDSLTYTATLADGSTLPSWLSFDPTTRTFSGTPLDEDVGTFSLLVTATDNQGAIASDSFDLTVNNVEETSDRTIIEYGKVENLTDTLQTINLTTSFTNPVVFVQPLSANDSDPAIVRLQNITSNSFDLQVQEPNHLDNIHSAEGVSYFVVEAGTWTLPDGKVLQAGTTESENQVSQGWDNITFNEQFTNTPAVFSQVQTYNGIDFVRTRQNNLSTTGFEFGMEEEEALKDTAHKPETLGWMAIESGNGNWLGNDYQIGTTGDTVTHDWRTLNFASNFDSAPQLLASLTSYDGPDPAGLRHRNLATNSVDLQIEEDTSYDSEVKHTTENVSFMALKGEGVITEKATTTVTPQVFGETGTLNLTDAAQTINLINSYDNPVVFLQPLSANGPDPATVRMNNLTANSFTASIQEPNYLVDAGKGGHTEETVSYFVMEAGTWQLEDGTLLEVGTTESEGLVEKGVGFDPVDFNTQFAATPIVLSQVQTANDSDFVRTRQQNSTVNGFEVALEEEEANANSGHGTETVGWLAMETGSGQWGDFNYYAERTSDTITHDWTAIGFDSLFNQSPQVAASISSYDGFDASGVRYDNLTATGMDIKVEEDQSLDDEIIHTSEIVDVLAVEGSGSLSAIPVEPMATAGMTSNAIAPVTLANNTLFDSNETSGVIGQ
ncbi:putative Ig domain-containing protein [Myxosarcina sp. GI1]|uniref:putative Ig domain-containing protein n=1 Tax=Myxosarcina sp. GI1 TaxID=1541065 RepID=UPI000689BD6C|nr:putative Ig domain-containing protein [Myxosarcina sp. GI1]